ncbi:MAG: 2Fe-2S iron-sulfur cluster-binding protein [Candidatus Sumerlaeia bacterium]|nr:2Fe-2S iron-sulfur cluster-binding protein [Candidatus Sumerlaeia bacterium]
MPTYDKVECKTSSPLAEGLLAMHLEVPMLCGGNGRCATCHVLVVGGAENLSPVEAKEERALAMLSTRQPNTRLSCQARVLGDVQVAIPNATFIERIDELDAMVGKRAERDICDAIDGRVLVKAGQIISKYVINKLRQSN